MTFAGNYYKSTIHHEKIITIIFVDMRVVCM